MNRKHRGARSGHSRMLRSFGLTKVAPQIADRRHKVSRRVLEVVAFIGQKLDQGSAVRGYLYGQIASTSCADRRVGAKDVARCHTRSRENDHRIECR